MRGDTDAVRSRLIFTEHRRVADWCEARIEHFSGWGSDPKAIGYEVEGVIKGGVVYTNYTGANVFLSIALEAPFTRSYLHAIFFNPFIAWGLNHVSAAVDESNVKSLNLCVRTGLQIEGRMRESAIDGGDVILLGMLKRECRWIKQ